MSAQSVERLRKLAAGWVESGNLQALVVLAARRGTIVFHDAFGRQTPDSDSHAASRDTIFPVASISKAITATAAMILVEEGRLGVNRPVVEYLPEFVGAGKGAVMVHHLLTHTSGFRDEDVDAHADRKKGAIQSAPAGATEDPELHEYFALRWDAPLWKSPGEEMSYCNYGYRLLGEIVRRLTRVRFSDFARERIFAPLGMKDTHFGLPKDLWNRAVRHAPSAWGAYMDEFDRPLGASPSGGAWSTGVDLGVFCQMFLNRGAYGDFRILSPVTVAEMTRNHIPGISSTFFDEFFPEASFGLGWSVIGNKRGENGALSSREAFEHGGDGGVYVWVDPVYEIVGVYLSAARVPESESRRGHMVREAFFNDLFTDAVTAAITDM